MRLQTFTAPNMQAAIKLIKEELGRDAVIVATKKVEQPDGSMGLEITAAMDRPITPPPAPVAPKINADAGVVTSSAEQAPVNDDFDLLMNGHGIATEVSERLRKAASGLGDAGFSHADALEMVLGKLLKFQHPAELFPCGQLHVLVGPTGAGKTTLASKLALSRKSSGQSIALLSLDDQKIGGFEQLALVAEALGEQAHLIPDESALREAAKKLGKRQFLLVDTPGLNPYDQKAIQEFAKRLQQLPVEPVVHLVLPATLDSTLLPSMPVAFAGLKPRTLLFTKMDETRHYGGVVNVAANHPLAVGIYSDNPQPAADAQPLDAALLAQKLAKKPTYPWERE